MKRLASVVLACLMAISGVAFGPSSHISNASGLRYTTMHGNDLRLLVDGTPLVEAHDNHYLTGDTAGLIDGQVQINVRSIRIIAL